MSILGNIKPGHSGTVKIRSWPQKLFWTKSSCEVRVSRVDTMSDSCSLFTLSFVRGSDCEKPGVAWFSDLCSW